MRLVLASASPRRADLLRAAGYSFIVHAVDVDETPLGREAPDGYVVRLAKAKAELAARAHPDAIVLGADTTVVVDGAILGKPENDDEARAMLTKLSGRAHEVMTGVCLCRDAATLSGIETTVVRFRPLSREDIERYVASGEPRDKAGAYAIQGGAAGFVTAVDGSYSNVVGLPMERVEALFGDWGIRPVDVMVDR